MNTKSLLNNTQKLFLEKTPWKFSSKTENDTVAPDF